MDKTHAMVEWRKFPPNSRPDGFWERVQKTDGCWLWQGRTDRDGYGLLDFYWNGKRETRAPRIAFLLAGGELASKQLVMHSCDTPACVNPEHLTAGSPLDNMRDKIAKGRGRATGPRLDAPQVWEIRRFHGLYEVGELAGMYSVSVKTVLDIQRGNTWATQA